MYIFAQHGILSVVAHHKPGMLMVRAVSRTDLEHFWPAAKIVETIDGDYHYRTTLPCDAVAERIAQAVRAVNYEKVKPSVDVDRQPAYMSAWAAMMDLQEQLTPGPKR